MPSYKITEIETSTTTTVEAPGYAEAILELIATPSPTLQMTISIKFGHAMVKDMQSGAIYKIEML